jgi:hypothetical protein
MGWIAAAIISQGYDDGRTWESSQRVAQRDQGFAIEVRDDAEYQVGAFHRLDFLFRWLGDGFDFQRSVL